MCRYLFFICLAIGMTLTACDHHKKHHDTIITFEKTIGGPYSENATDGLQTEDGGYLILGYMYNWSNGHTSAFLYKTDEYGDTLWRKTYFYDNGSTNSSTGLSSIRPTSDGGYILAGSAITNRNHWGDNDFYIVKINNNGDTLWTRFYDTTYTDGAQLALQTDDQGYIIFGDIAEVYPDGGSKNFIIKTNSSGMELWTKPLSFKYITSVYNTSDNCYVFSCTNSDGTFIAKIDYNASLIWQQQMGTSTPFWARAVNNTSDNCFILTGSTKQWNNIHEDLYLVKTTTTGDTIWTKAFGNPAESEIGVSVIQTEDNGFLVAGDSYSDTRSTDIYLLKTDLYGNKLLTVS